MHRTLNYLDREQAQYRALNAALASPLPHLEIQARRAQRDRFEQVALAYAAKVREAIPTIDVELLDDYRRAAEGYGDRIIVGDLTGVELARLCDEEIAGRYITDALHVPHIDADARARAIRNEVIRGLDDAIATAVGAVAVLAASIGIGAAVHFVGSVL